MATDPTDFDALIDAAAAGPAEAEADGQKVVQQPLPNLIAAANRQAAVNATRRSGMGLRTRRMIPPDAAS